MHGLLVVKFYIKVLLRILQVEINLVFVMYFEKAELRVTYLKIYINFMNKLDW